MRVGALPPRIPIDPLGGPFVSGVAPALAGGDGRAPLHARPHFYGIGAILYSLLAVKAPSRGAPLQVVIGAKSYDEGVDPEATPDTIAEALRAYQPVSTSRPTPAVFLEAYEKAARLGYHSLLVPEADGGDGGDGGDFDGDVGGGHPPILPAPGGGAVR
mgnify:CR=1 FL=1